MEKKIKPVVKKAVAKKVVKKAPAKKEIKGGCDCSCCSFSCHN